MSDKARSHHRAECQTTLTFSAPVAMKAEVTKMADAENRTVSNYLRILLAEHLKKSAEADLCAAKDAQQKARKAAMKGVNEVRKARNKK